jgi:hypothetical protein
MGWCFRPDGGSGTPDPRAPRDTANAARSAGVVRMMAERIRRGWTADVLPHRLRWAKELNYGIPPAARDRVRKPALHRPSLPPATASAGGFVVVQADAHGGGPRTARASNPLRVHGVIRPSHDRPGGSGGRLAGRRLSHRDEVATPIRRCWWHSLEISSPRPMPPRRRDLENSGVV